MAEAERVPRSVANRRPEATTRAEARLTSAIVHGLARVEDVVYVGLSILLALLAVGLLIEGGVSFAQAVAGGELGTKVPLLLDRFLLILMVVEILYTVQVSLREHTLTPEPFLVVGLIAGIRRILVLTAEFANMVDESETFRNAMLELSILTGMVIVLVAALAILRRRAA